MEITVPATMRAVQYVVPTQFDGSKAIATLACRPSRHGDNK